MTNTILYRLKILLIIILVLIFFTEIFVIIKYNDKVEHYYNCVDTKESAVMIAKAYYKENYGIQYNTEEFYVKYNFSSNTWNVDPEYYKNVQEGWVVAGYHGIYINRKTGRISEAEL